MSQFGPTYKETLDAHRLSTQLDFIRKVMLGAQWLTLEEIARLAERASGGRRFPQASVSAQLRHLRKPQHGSYILEARRRQGTWTNPHSGLYEYRLLPPPARAPAVQLNLLDAAG